MFLGEHLDKDGEEIEDNIFTKPYSELDDEDKKKVIAFLNAKDDRHSAGDVFNPENKPNLPKKDGIGKATELKDKIIEFREFLLKILKESIDDNLISDNGDLSSLIEEINTTLDIKDGKVYGEKGKKVSWEYL